jgi:tetratricopeptide (TPR) repeat protein
MLAALSLSACSKDPAVEKQRHFERAGRYVAEEKYNEAIVEYLNAVEIDPRFADARVKLAEAYARIGDRANALREYVRAADLLPQDTKVQLTAGSHLLTVRRFADARARAEGVIAREPGNVTAHVLLGNALAGLQSLNEAVATIEEAIRLDPKLGSTYANLGLLETVRGNRTEAEAAFKKATELQPNWAGGYLALAQHHWSGGRTAEAERDLKAALALAPADPLVNRAVAVFYVSTARATEAELYLKRVADETKDPAAILGLADYYVSLNRPKDAISTLEPLRTNSRTYAAATKRQAEAYLMLQDRQTALRLADEMLARAPKGVDGLLLKARLRMVEGSRDEALTLAKNAVDVSPESAEVQFAFGRILAARNEYDDARKAFGEVLRLNPRAAVAQAELAKLDLATGNPATSVKLADQAIASAPTYLEGRLVLVRALIANREFVRAEKELQPLISRYPRDASLQSLQAIVAAATDRTAAAREGFQRAREIDPKSLQALEGLLVLDLAAGKTDAVMARLAQEVQSRPQDAQVHLVAGRISLRARRFPEARQHLTQAITLDPAMLPAYTMLVQLSLSERNLDATRQDLQRLVAQQPRHVGALTLLGVIEETQGNMDAARNRYKQALALDRDAAVAANNLAWIYAEAGEALDEALSLAQRAAARLPESPQVNDTLGWVYYKRNMPALAVDALKRSTAKDPKNAGYHYHLGLAYAQAGDSTRARESLTTALATNPKAPWADDARRALNNISPAEEQR